MSPDLTPPEFTLKGGRSGPVLDLFVYPVSGVMKLWHLLLHNVLNLDDSIAWLLSIFGLVIVVRALIAPFSVAMVRSGRVSVLLRPALRSLDEEYRTRTDEDSVAEYQRKKKQLHADYGYHPLAGCMPALIQLPVFIGLYQVLLRMARPVEGLDAAEHSPIGFLTSEEVGAFLDSRIFNAPLPAYVAMDPTQHALLDTTRGDVLAVVLPLLLTAILFTSFNLGVSLYRNSQTMDWNNKIARGARRFLVVMVIFVPVLLIWLALAGPLPTAIVAYWVANNLWTLAQATIINAKIDRELPLPSEHHELRRESYTSHKQRLQEEKNRKSWERRKRRQARREPERGEEIRAEIKAREQERIDAHEAQRAEAKRLNREKARARRALKRKRQAQKKAEKPETAEQENTKDPNQGLVPALRAESGVPDSEEIAPQKSEYPGATPDDGAMVKPEESPDNPR